MTTEILTETTETLRAEAQQLRDHVEQLRAEQDSVIAAAQAEADRLLAAARQQANELRLEAERTDRQAKAVEERCQYFVHRDLLREQLGTAAGTVTTLTREVDGLRAEVADLDEQLAALAVDRQETEAALAAATDAGDIDAAVTARSRLSALDDVAAARTRQRGTAADRLGAIGEPDGAGELRQAVGRHGGLQAELRRVENLIDPKRPEAILDAHAEWLTQVAQHAAQEQQAPARRANTIIRN